MTVISRRWLSCLSYAWHGCFVACRQVRNWRFREGKDWWKEDIVTLKVLLTAYNVAYRKGHNKGDILRKGDCDLASQIGAAWWHWHLGHIGRPRFVPYKVMAHAAPCYHQLHVRCVEAREVEVRSIGIIFIGRSGNVSADAWLGEGTVGVVVSAIG